jgi:thioesterase domain-containing protein
MAAAIEDAVGGANLARSRPIMLRPGLEGHRPFFGVPGLRGNVLNLHQLALAVPWARPFYGLQPPGLSDGEVPLRRISELAAHHVAQIREIQPHGPYAIGGYSLGGLVAYEMGCQLEAQGEAVECIAIIDTYRPGLKPPPERGLKRRLKRRLSPYARRLLRRPSAASAAGQRKVVDERLATLVFAHRQAARAYRPAALSASLVVFSTEQRGKWSRTWGSDASLGWEGLAAGRFETHTMPGTHHAVMARPHVEVLATRLAEVFSAGAEHR